MKHIFTIGQRWISDTELELGLGIVTAIDLRRVKIEFPLCQQQRIYASDDAPLTRVNFQSGEEIESTDGSKLTVLQVEENEGLLIYHCRDSNEQAITLEESQLAHQAEFNDPFTRLRNGQYDKVNWFRLRQMVHQQSDRLAHSSFHGLSGARIDLVPHQMYIAHSVTSRHAPRILLADEVGLGKTIEACLILHQMLINRTASRAIIIVPETLLHQWLVELLRRFNLRFSIFDDERFQDMQQQHANPFLTEQLVLCSLDFLVAHPQHTELAQQAEWDIMIVDEAHHLYWSETSSSPEYSTIETLAHVVPSVLLLTATPEQLGKAGHFARLRLLDPERFFDLDTFVKEESSYNEIADAVAELMSHEKLSDASAAHISSLLQDAAIDDHLHVLQHTEDSELVEASRHACLVAMIDRHGTGRLLFRNTRAAIGGFPQRQCHPVPLAEVSEYRFTNEERQADLINACLSPERTYMQLHSDAKHWCDVDTRVAWLIDFLKNNQHKKVLVICHHADTALELQEWLRKKVALACSVFHEGMSIIERDRAAAYFADPDDGAQVLICSEIGSEGRNFQFAHNLVLFDLPLNPDLLEQRIGRLDRIGQKHDISVHVPYFQDHVQHSIFSWYHDGLNAIEQNCAVAQAIFSEVKDDLLHIMEHQLYHEERTQQLVTSTRELYERYHHSLQKNRDRLLEYNSCRPDVSEELVYELHQQDDDTMLEVFVRQMFDLYGINFDYHSEETFVASASDHMLIAHFPHIPEEGMTLTFSRRQALIHEPYQFMSWEHPLIRDALDLIMSGEHGRTALSVYNIKHQKPGQLFIELLYQFDCSAPETLQIQRYVDTTYYRLLIDKDGKDASHLYTRDEINGELVHLNRQTGLNVIRTLIPTAEKLLKQIEPHIDSQLEQLVKTTTSRMDQELQSELERLEYLQRINPSIRDEELDHIKDKAEQLREYLGKSRFRLDAMHVIVTA